MKFYFDESGNFQLPPKGEHRAGIVSGIAIPDSDEPEIFRRFDTFVGKLPSSAFKNGEPKGRLLDDAALKEFAHMFVDLPGILFCPIMLDLTSLVGQSQADVAGLVSKKLMQIQTACKHESFRTQLVELANDVRGLSIQQALRLVAWAKCVSRTVQDSMIHHSGTRYDPAWDSLRFEFDPVEQTPGNREERIFNVMLPMWISSWSYDDPVTLIEGVHTAEHPLVKNWDTETGLDIGKMFSKNVYYVSSFISKGVQLADISATLVRRAVIGIANAVNLQNYGFMMTKAIGRPLYASGIFCIGPAEIRELERRYHGLADAINGARGSIPGSYCLPQ